MTSSPAEHFRKTASLARALRRPQVYKWLVTTGYFPEPYVLPPCFFVSRHPGFQKPYFRHTGTKFAPKITECLVVQFPKTNLTDRTFGIINPEIHSDIARTIAWNWKSVCACLFHQSNRVNSYSFPVPLDRGRRGAVGALRSGRMIYEFVEMENGLSAIAYRYKYLVTADVKNFYPSIYTHSIPWALHGKKRIRKRKNRANFNFFGNRLDKLFQNANDGCTNGVPIGPAVSDLIAEVVLAGVDRILSAEVTGDVVITRFKDDYRILVKTEGEVRSVIRALQAALKEFNLELSDDKTEIHALPDGLFRKWVSDYQAANPHPKRRYQFKRFKEVYLSVVKIDRDHQGSGVIDRFLADLVAANGELRLTLNSRRLPQMISLLLMLASLRTKAFPKVLAIIEAILRSPFGGRHADEIANHLTQLLLQLREREIENRYQIAWICYFLRANGFEGGLKRKLTLTDPIVRAAYTSRFTAFRALSDFKLFQGVKTSARRTSMLGHLNVFRR